MDNGYSAAIPKLYAETGSLTESGAPVVLGVRQTVPAGSVDRVLGYILISSGALVGDDLFYLDAAYKAAPANYETFGLNAESGGQSWVMVYNSTGATIERGTPVKWVASADDTNIFHVTPCVGGEEMDQILGVAQFDIPTLRAAFVLCYGPGVAVAGETAANSKRGDAITIDAAAGRVIEATADSISWGRFLQDALTDGSLCDVYINCRGV